MHLFRKRFPNGAGRGDATPSDLLVCIPAHPAYAAVTLYATGRKRDGSALDVRWWILLGGLLQALGVLTIVLEYLNVRKQIELYFKRPTIVRVGTIHAEGHVFGAGVVGGATPTVEERLNRLEEGLAQLREDERTKHIGMAAEWREEIREAQNAAAEDARREDEALAGLLLGTASFRWWRFAAAASIIVGILMQAIAGFIATK